MNNRKLMIIGSLVWSFWIIWVLTFKVFPAAQAGESWAVAVLLLVGAGSSFLLGWACCMVVFIWAANFNKDENEMLINLIRSQPRTPTIEVPPPIYNVEEVDDEFLQITPAARGLMQDL